MNLGDRASTTRAFTEDDVLKFAEISGDKNKLHIDSAYASSSIFGGCIVHGMFVKCMVSALLGMQLPGPGTIYISSQTNFRLPVRINDVLTATVEVADIINKDKGIYQLKSLITNQNGELVMDGIEIVKYKPKG